MELKHPSRQDIAYHFCVSYVDGALAPGSRFSNILSSMFHGRQLTVRSLEHLQILNLNELHQLAVGHITYNDYIAALTPALVAREQAAKAEHQAIELQHLQFERQRVQGSRFRAGAGNTSRKTPKVVAVKSEEEITALRKTAEADRAARAAELKAAEVERAVQFKKAETARVTRYEYNLKTAAALYKEKISKPGYVVETDQQLLEYYQLSKQGTTAITELSNILRTLYQGDAIAAADIRYLKSSGALRLYKLAIGLLTYKSYIADINAEERAVKQAETRAAAIEAERILRIKQAEELRLQREKEAEAARLVRMKLVEEQRLEREASTLRGKYGITAQVEKSLLAKLMGVLQSIDSGNRLTDEEFVWLQTKAKQYFTEQLRITYHLREADFYANEYQQTQDPWKAINASGHYRKCKQPESALELVVSVPAKNLKNPKVHSAFCTTYGGAMRDVKLRKVALQLGKQAHELQPKAFQPCTLLGALHIELGNFTEGHEWYGKAEERGASKQSIDTELKNIFLHADKTLRETLKVFLLADNPDRYSWVNDKKYRNN